MSQPRLNPLAIRKPAFFKPKQSQYTPPKELRGTIVAIIPGGDIKVRFQQLMFDYAGKQFEVVRASGSGVLTSLGVGTLQVRAPGHCFLIPGPSGFSQLQVGDAVRVYGG